MTRFLVLEVVEGQGGHDLTDFLDDMYNRDRGRAKLVAGDEQGFPHVLAVKIPTRPLVQEFALTGPNRTKLYIEEAR